MSKSEARKLIQKYLKDSYETEKLEVKSEFPRPSNHIEQIVSLANYRDINYFVVGIDEPDEDSEEPELNSISTSKSEDFIEGLEGTSKSNDVSPKLNYDYYTLEINDKTLFVIELDYVNQELYCIGEGRKCPFRVNSGTQMLTSEQIKTFYKTGKIPFSENFEYASYPNKPEVFSGYVPVKKENNIDNYALPITNELRENQLIGTKFGKSQIDILENLLYRIDNHTRTSCIRNGTICISQNNCNWYNKGNGREFIAAIENPSKLPNPEFKVDKYKTYSSAYVRQYRLEYNITLTLIVEVNFNQENIKNGYLSMFFSHRPATDDFLSSLKKTTNMRFGGWRKKEFETKSEEFDISTNKIKLKRGSKDSCLIFAKNNSKRLTEDEIFVTPELKWEYPEKDEINEVNLDSIKIYNSSNFAFGLTLYNPKCYVIN